MSSNHDQELFPITVTILGQTEKAIRVDTGDGTKWVPKSLIENEEEVEEKGFVGATVEIEMPVWFLEKEGLV